MNTSGFAIVFALVFALVFHKFAKAMSSVVLATASYDHTIRFWEPPSGVCNRTIQYNDSVRISLRIAFFVFFVH
jgi:hypothetical protein